MKKRGPISIQEINADLRRQALSGDETWCPCCGQRVAVKLHRITENMVDFLRRLAARAQAFGGGWYRTVDIVPHVKGRHQKRSSDGPSARYWGLILASDDSVNAAGAPAGSYQITEFGLEFLRGDRAVAAKAFVLNGELWNTGQETVFVNQVKGVAFDFQRDVVGLSEELKKLPGQPDLFDE
jgi:hypothetical protein